MKKIFLVLTALLVVAGCKQKEPTDGANNSGKEDLKTPFENGNGNQTATYEEAIAYYKTLAQNFATVYIEEIGLTDSGEPLHLVTFSKKEVDWNSANEDAIKILINNGIHAGESDGIDASMMLLRDLATGAVKAPDNLIFCVIPVYNIGGALNRNSTSRTNQNGPESYGFRGNARNYDLNRDFIKEYINKYLEEDKKELIEKFEEDFKNINDSDPIKIEVLSLLGKLGITIFKHDD